MFLVQKVILKPKGELFINNSLQKHRKGLLFLERANSK